MPASSSAAPRPCPPRKGRFARHVSLGGLVVALVILLAVSADAHKVTAVRVAANFDTQKRTYKVEMAMDIDPSDDSQINAEITPEMAARQMASEALVLQFGEKQLRPEPKVTLLGEEGDAADDSAPSESPEAAAPSGPAPALSEPEVFLPLRLLVTLEGKIPKGEDEFTLYVTPETEAAVILLSVVDGKRARRVNVLYPGETSRAVQLSPLAEGDPFDKSPSRSRSDTSGSTENASDEESNTSGELSLGIFWWDGFRYILPSGLPALLLATAFYLLNARRRDLLWQAGIFIVAYSATMTLIAFGAVSVPLSITDTWMPASLVLISAHNLWRSKLDGIRLFLIFSAGCAFGLWFAEGYYYPSGITSRSVLCLTAYNLGLAIAFAVALTILALALRSLRAKESFERIVGQPAKWVTLALSLWVLLDRWPW